MTIFTVLLFELKVAAWVGGSYWTYRIIDGLMVKFCGPSDDPITALKVIFGKSSGMSTGRRPSKAWSYTKELLKDMAEGLKIEAAKKSESRAEEIKQETKSKKTVESYVGDYNTFNRCCGSDWTLEKLGTIDIRNMDLSDYDRSNLESAKAKYLRDSNGY